MIFTWMQLLVWVLIACGIGCTGELIAGRHNVRDCVTSSSFALLAIVLLVGIFHFHFIGEVSILKVPLVSTVFVAALFVGLWSGRLYYR